MDRCVFHLLRFAAVMGFVSSTSEVKNLALRGKATQSSFVEQPYQILHGHPYKAIDGKTSSEYSQGSCTHTKTEENPWWRLDLQDKYTINTIIITNRGDCCSERINGAEIHVGNSLSNNGNDNPRVALISSIPAGQSERFLLNEAVSGRYINVIIPGKNQILTLCEVEVFGTRSTEETGPLKGEASQSSYSENAFKAIDGNPSGNYFSGSCTHTATEENPWWRLDLQDEYNIDTIEIANRGDCCSERINGAEIRVGNSLSNDGNNNPRVAVISSIPGGKSESFVVRGVSGRFVNVIIPGKDQILTLCEVRVFGTRNTGGSYELEGVASQSSDWGTPGNAYKAIDGNRDGNFFSGSCSHTLNDWAPWWKLDLLKTYKVCSVTITNRQDAVSDRLNGAEIRIGDSTAHNGVNNPRCGVVTSIGEIPSVTFQCYGMKGRYITIVIPGRREYLTLCEVEVSGSPLH